MCGNGKVNDPNLHVSMIGTMLLTFLSTIMKGSHANNRLRTICECIFGTALFGVTATKMVLAEVYKQYILAEQQSKFSNWWVLRAIDLSPVSGLNYNGIETLGKVEELENYERGILPSGSSECLLGEVYQYDFQKTVRFILKAFGLYELAQ